MAVEAQVRRSSSRHCRYDYVERENNGIISPHNGQQSSPSNLYNRSALLERGELDSLEYLIALNYLGYAEYRDWRYRRRPELQSALKMPVEEVTAALAQAQTYVAAQGLTVEICPPRSSWNGQRPNKSLPAAFSATPVASINRSTAISLFSRSSSSSGIRAMDFGFRQKTCQGGKEQNNYHKEYYYG